MESCQHKNSRHILKAGIILTMLFIGLIISACGQNATSTASSADEANSNAVAAENSPEKLFELGNNYYQTDRYDDAVAAFSRAIDLQPDYDAAYANLGAVYYAQQKLGLAEETYNKAIKLSPNDADLIYNLGAIYLQQSLTGAAPDQQRLTLAIETIQQAINLNPKLAQPYYGLGVAYQISGKNEEAIQAFETFLDLDDGSDPVATSNATKILQELKANAP